ncbi:MAG TPA: efflux RND transporter periplasmic adaptor subunit [Rubrivivax sp.]|nr:efflux RND transporter periplasmic adaptor subunit [Rubrivivax sp.]
MAVVAAVAALWTTRKAEVQAGTVMTAYPSAQHALLTASGYVVAQRRAAVSSKATGRLIELRVREGSTVEEGELIGRLDASDVAAAMQAAQAGQRQAEATLQQAEAGVRQAQVEVANAEAELRRVLELRAQDFVSPQAVDTAQRRADAARAGVAQAQAGIAAARGNIAAAAAQVQVQAVNRANTEIRAPFSGVVLVKNANVGDMITPFSSAAGAQGAVVTMADMGTLEVEADVSESNVGQVAIDMPVEITLDALPEARFRGSVVRIVPTVDRAKATVMTKIRFERLDPRVLPEMSAKVVFLKQRPTEADFQPVLAVNPRAVVQRDGRPVVLRIGEGEVLQAVPVSAGRTLGDLLEVGSGDLKAGERLVLDAGDELQAGARVTVAGK